MNEHVRRRLETIAAQSKQGPVKQVNVSVASIKHAMNYIAELEQLVERLSREAVRRGS